MKYAALLILFAIWCACLLFSVATPLIIGWGWRVGAMVLITLGGIFVLMEFTYWCENDINERDEYTDQPGQG